MNDAKYRFPVILRQITDDSANFKPLPKATGTYPYRLDIDTVPGLNAADFRDRMAFHMVGDTGSARQSYFQEPIASALSRQLEGTNQGKPAFLYHLGDIVYNHGEAKEYPAQFLGPYRNYHAPIFAIPGNHDADINPESANPYESLDAFLEVFCDSQSRPISFAVENPRMSMTQPNVYWTLITPLARFIGLYANVTKFGTITDEQRNWFTQELLEAGRHAQAIIVCVHHAPYSADTNHGSSQQTIDFLDAAFHITGVYPDLVCSGHVHNYQRFSKQYADDIQVPYIVAGAGGYADLHSVALENSPDVSALTGDDSVALVAYCDDRFGFLKLDIQKIGSEVQIIGEYYTLQDKDNFQPALYDRFEIPCNRSAQLNLD